MQIDILCRVVDNLGDIGFVYRLARCLSELPDAPRLRLIVDDLEAFAAICSEVQPDTPVQTVSGWTVVRWNNPGEAGEYLFRTERPRFVLECYACGRPDWFESILFDENDRVIRHIINLEYLTAESWARDFHKLPSMTRSPLVRKTVFMPGLQAGTGGLLQDAAFSALVERCATRAGRLAVRDASCVPANGNEFRIFVFSYEHDFTSLVADIASFNMDQPVLALVAAGRSSAPFLDAWNRAGRPFRVQELPLVNQTTWDELLLSSDFAIVRGEETFARACLSGRPFLWECYPFSGDNSAHGGQLPKVHAFLGLIEPYMAPAVFAEYKKLVLSFNRETAPEIAAGNFLSILRAVPARGTKNGDNRPDSGDGIGFSFETWSRDVRNLGNLAVNLVTFMHDLG